MFTPENKGVIKIGYLSYNSVTFLYYIINCHFFLRYSEGEIRFNLMAIVSDRKMIYEQKIAELQRQLAEEPMDTDQGSNMLSAIQSEVAKNQMLIEEEVQKLKRYKVSVSLLFFNVVT